MWKQRNTALPGPEDEEAVYGRYLSSLLARGVLTKAGAIMKMERKGASRELAERIAEKFEEAGMIDDRAYALLFAETHPEWGRRRLQDELRRKGVEGRFIRKSLEDLDEEARAAALAEEWAGFGVEERKITERLLRRGFPFSVSRKAAERACEGEG
ncbi:MAG: RecX family transcriptional regulator [Synergistaceae bacterium]|uniref:regulatory protein RecX n=1 Tax=Aminivibrio sp. TaxID=1872489 RepID=UPI0016A55E7B|nr:RecX family transcriptional regulator [Synergistaceae bacterium]NCC56162.1 hypothetical protein [Synergistales bacterium]MDD3391369.1 RecX family transcriptional regulator [Synergistaceae bacterium]MDD3689137.1 RecX family transcriptional regulator [Synergistaceae bacterium]MDD4020166.1 RecX family transcriptional regulator [Synergistaceae bacterium]